MKTGIKLFKVMGIAGIMAIGMSAAASAALSQEVLSVNGRTGDIGLNAGEYNYPLKYLYDIKQPGGGMTLAGVVEFLSTGRQEGYSARVDIDAFVNSALGELTALEQYTSCLFSDEMDPKLVEYYGRIGLLKEAYYDDPDTDDGITGNYFVFSPNNKEIPEEGWPLIVVYHGGGAPTFSVDSSGFVELAAKEGLVIAVPQETGNPESTGNMIKAVKEHYSINDSMVYIAGTSGGGSAALAYALGHQTELAGAAVMDQPVTVETRWYTATDEELAQIGETGFNLVYLGGTADMYGLHGILTAGARGEVTTEFFETSEGNEDQFISGWNRLMAAYGIEGKEIESRLQFQDDPDANAAERYDGYPFDNVDDIDPSGTSPIWKCTMDGVDTLTLYLVYNRAHMPSGYDAENIWNELSRYTRNTETGMMEPAK